MRIFFVESSPTWYALGRRNPFAIAVGPDRLTEPSWRPIVLGGDLDRGALSEFCTEFCTAGRES